MSYTPEPAIWSSDTGQQIPCFDSCQLTMTWTSNIKDARLGQPIPVWGLPSPPLLSPESVHRSVVRWRHNQIFSAWWVNHCKGRVTFSTENKTYLVCPIRWTRPTACSSWAGFNAGSTNNTWVASMMFRPLEPVCKGRRRTPTKESCLNVCRFDWKEENLYNYSPLKNKTHTQNAHKGEIIDMTRAWDKEKMLLFQAVCRTHVIHELSLMASLSMSSRSSVNRAPARCSGGHGFNSRRELYHARVMFVI